MHKMLFLAIFSALLMKTVLGAVCEGLRKCKCYFLEMFCTYIHNAEEQKEEILVTVDAVCKNQTLTLSWNRNETARPTPYSIECKNGTRTVVSLYMLDNVFI